jgi:tripartite-type tricarboxylate transporter receptor subunit TctC
MPVREDDDADNDRSTARGVGRCAAAHGRVARERVCGKLGQQVVIDNRPGAAGNLGTELVVSAPPDGYTILFATVANSINESLYETLPFKLERDLASVSLLTKLPNVLEVNLDLPITDVRGLIDYARAHPGALNFGSGGTGTSVHLSGELFKALTGISMVHVPYRGAAAALADVIAGQVQLMFDNLPGSIEQIRAGRVRALAVTDSERSPALPELPTIAEAGVPGYAASAWFGVMAPANLPRERVMALNQALNQGMTRPALRERLLEMGARPAVGTPEALAAHIDAEMKRWAPIVRATGLTID